MSCVWHAANTGVTRTKVNGFRKTFGFNEFEHCVIVGCVVHNKGDKLSIDKFWNNSEVSVNSYPSFQAIHLQALPYLFSHVFTGMLTCQLAEVNKGFL